MKSNGLLGEKLPFYQKVLNMTLGIGSDRSPSTRKAEEPLASPFRRGYTRPGRPGLPVTPIVVTTTPGHPAHIGTPTGTGSATKHGSASSTAASIFRSFRRRSLRRSFRRTKSFLVKNPTTPTTNTSTATGTNKEKLATLRKSLFLYILLEKLGKGFPVEMKNRMPGHGMPITESN